MKYDIFDLIKELENKSNKINEIFDSKEFLDRAISMAWVVLEEQLGIDDDAKRDEISEILCDFGNGDVKKVTAAKKIFKIAGKAIPLSSSLAGIINA